MKQSKVSVKYSEQNFVFKQVSYKYLFNVFGWEGKGGGVGRALVQGLALINFFCL